MLTVDLALQFANLTPMARASVLRQFEDKLYLYATGHRATENGIDLFFEGRDCLTFLNDRLRAAAVVLCQSSGVPHVWAEQAPTVHELRDGARPGVLLSAAAIVRDQDDKLLLIKRDEGAPVEPLRWQFPGGRSETVCAEITALDELFQEVRMAHRGSGLVLGREDVRPSPVNLDAHTLVTVYLDGQPHYQSRVYCLMDERLHTLEQFIELRVPGRGEDYTLSDREYGRQVRFVEPESLVRGDFPLVNYLDQMKRQFITTTDNR